MGSVAGIADVGIAAKYYYKNYDTEMEHTIVSTKDFNAYFGDNHVVKNVNIEIPHNNVVAVMGPSGCGKTTFLRCINRMHELIPNATSNGKIFLNNEDVYGMHPTFARRNIRSV